MAWDRGQFNYNGFYLDLLLEGYQALYQVALGDPDASAAILVYDLGRAIDGAGLTRRQREAISLRKLGYTYLEMAGFMQVSIPVAFRRARIAMRKMEIFLNGGVIKPPLKVRNVGEGVNHG